jgi:hypothetical protein
MLFPEIVMGVHCSDGAKVVVRALPVHEASE